MDRKAALQDRSKYVIVKRAPPSVQCECSGSGNKNKNQNDPSEKGGGVDGRGSTRQSSDGIDYASPLRSKVYVGGRTNVKSTVKRLLGQLVSGVHGRGGGGKEDPRARVSVHGMGKAVPVAVRVALALQDSLCGANGIQSVQLCTHTHSVTALDDFEPQVPNLPRVTKSRHISAVCIQIQCTLHQAALQAPREGEQEVFYEVRNTGLARTSGGGGKNKKHKKNKS
jgi:hypothetical protein